MKNHTLPSFIGGVLIASGLVLSGTVRAQVDVIEACSEMAQSALRTFMTHSDELATIAYSYADYCSLSSRYESLSQAKQSSFNAVYRQVNRLGFGSSRANASVSEVYEAFCSSQHDFSSVDQRSLERVSTIHSNALATINLCIESARHRVTVRYTTPPAPEDPLNITFQLSSGGSQRIDGVSASNAVCMHGDRVLTPQLTPPLEISSNAISVHCRRHSEPIELFGLQGDRYPRTHISIFTNYAESAQEIIREETITGPLALRIDNLEIELKGLISNLSAQATDTSRRLGNIRFETRRVVSDGRSSFQEVTCNPDEVITGCYALLNPSGGSLCGVSIRDNGRTCRTGNPDPAQSCGVPQGQYGYRVFANCSRVSSD